MSEAVSRFLKTLRELENAFHSEDGNGTSYGSSERILADTCIECAFGHQLWNARVDYHDLILKVLRENGFNADLFRSDAIAYFGSFSGGGCHLTSGWLVDWIADHVE